jgi:hypothetical protein
LADNPEVGRRFLVYKGRQTEDIETGYRRTEYGRTVDDIDDIDNRRRRVRVVRTQDTDNERTRDEGQTRDRRTEGARKYGAYQRVVKESRAAESVGL